VLFEIKTDAAMNELTNRQIVLASRPSGEPLAENFKLVESPLAEVGVNQVLLRTIYLSLDPYMRGRMSADPSYAAPLEIGGVMEGGTVSEVMASDNSRFLAGDIVLGYTGWQEYALSDGSGLRKLDASLAPVHTALGVLGMPGMTAYTGLLNIGQPKAGETVVVSAASGAVGAIVGQIARLKDCRVVGIAGSKEKCDYVVEELGFDACLSHRDAALAAQLAENCPQGIDIYFENVGGAVFEAVFPLLNPFARIPVCGLISSYNAVEPPCGPNQVPSVMRDILVKRLTFRGFIVRDFQAQQGEFIAAMAVWLKTGKIKYKVDLVPGLESAVKAFQGLLKGENFGKLIVQVAPESLS
jgi:NADPH-dependent curcumin reductase